MKTHNKFSFNTTQEKLVPNRDILDIKHAGVSGWSVVDKKTGIAKEFFSTREEAIEYRNTYGK